MPNGSIDKTFLGRLQTVPAVLLVAVACLHLLRLASTPAPIYASDEYAYLKRGIDFRQIDSAVESARDPGLQIVSNYVYLAVVRGVANLIGDPTPGLRAINFAGFFIFVAGLGAWFVSRFGAPGATGWFLASIAVLPAGVLILSPMPEVALTTAYSIVVVATLLLLSKAPIIVGPAVGLATAVMLYIKPHAVAPGLGIGALLLLRAVVSSDPLRWRRWLAPAAYTAGVVGGILIINTVLLGEVTVAPRFVGPFYTDLIGPAVSLTQALAGFPGVGRYAFLHVLLLIVLFPFAVAGMIEGATRFARRPQGDTAGLFDNLAVLTLFTTGALIAMVALFSNHVARMNEGEANRLHGRYLMLVFPSLLMVNAQTIARLRHQPESTLGRLAIHRGLLALYGLAAVALVVLVRSVKVYPWDYPELFSLFTGRNNYWPWVPPLDVRTWVIVGGAGALALCFALPRRVSLILGVSQVALLSVSLVTVTIWQESHARGQRLLGAAGRSLQWQLESDGGNLLVIGPDRSTTSYVLGGLLANPWVRSYPADAELRADIIPPGVSLVAMLGRYAVHFPYHTYEQRGPLKLYGLAAPDGGHYTALPP